MKTDLKLLERGLGVHFNNEKVLSRALRHRSKSAVENNERLEFLGDSVLSLIISSELYSRRQQDSEGQLSLYRANLVNGRMLARIAKNLELDNYVELGSGEENSGGRGRTSLLACTLEAIIGAIYQDLGFDICRKSVLEWFTPYLDDKNIYKKDAKTRLQEWLQGRKYTLPNYRVISKDGRSHEQIFTVLCELKEIQEKETGTGKSIREAEQNAAKLILERVEAL